MLDRQLDDPLKELNAYVDDWSTCIRGGTSSFCICAMLAAELPLLPAQIVEEVRGHFDDLTSLADRRAAEGGRHWQLRLQGPAAGRGPGLHGLGALGRCWPRVASAIRIPSIPWASFR